MHKNNLCDLLKRTFARIWKFLLLSLISLIMTLIAEKVLEQQFISNLLSQIVKHQYVYISVLIVCLLIVAVIGELFDD